MTPPHPNSHHATAPRPAAGEGIALHLGDCREVMAGLPGGSVNAIVTDPPYGIGYEHGGNPTGDGNSQRTRSDVQVEWGAIAGDNTPNGEWLSEAFRVLKDGSAIYLATRWDVEPEWRRLLTEAGFKVVQRLTWHKRVHGKGDLKGTFATTCEDVLFASKGRHILNSRPSMLLDVGCVPTWEERYHPHQKPVGLPRVLIEASTQPGGLVLDPFAGSGTTLVACIETGRRGIGIELSPEYHANAEARIADARLRLGRPHAPALRLMDRPLVPLPGQRTLFDSLEVNP